MWNLNAIRLESNLSALLHKIMSAAKPKTPAENTETTGFWAVTEDMAKTDTKPFDGIL